MYTVADVLNRDFSRSWPEAVALVREIASGVGSAAVPAPEDLLLDDNGDLTLGFASETSQHPVSGLAWILSGLLDGVDAPPQLRALAAENLGASPTHKTVEAFSAALAFFERPDRKSELRGIVRRLSAARSADDADTDTEAELQRLKEKVSGAAPREDASPKPPKQPRFTRRQKAIAAAAASVVATGVLVASQWSRLSSLSVSAAGVSRERTTDLVAGGLRRLGFTSETAAAASAPAASPAPKPTATTGTAAQAKTLAVDQRPRKGRDVLLPARRRAARVNATPTESQVSNLQFEGDVLTMAGLPLARLNPVRNDLSPVVAIESVRPPEALTPRVYSGADRQVEPARLLRPQLPREPAPGDETGYFVMTVDEHGNVEQVHLISPTHRYHDRMLVAAAKAWKFRPARLDGVNVRYQLRIPIILKGLP